MLLAWLRRKRLEARLIATEVGRLFAGDSKKRVHQMADPDRFLAQMGIDVNGD